MHAIQRIEKNGKGIFGNRSGWWGEGGGGGGEREGGWSDVEKPVGVSSLPAYCSHHLIVLL